MANPSIKLYYFDEPGRGEISRLLLAASGAKWEDIRFSDEEWPKFKPNAPFGQCPYLDYNGKIYGQSLAIATFLAREYGFAGKTSLESLKVDEVVQLVRDLRKPYVEYFYEEDKDKKAEIAGRAEKEDNPKFFTFFERLLEENGSGYFVGKQLTFADIAVFDCVVNKIKNDMKMLTADKDFPRLQALCAKVAAHPNIHNYLQKTC